jgi:hypothetical protein
MRNPLRWPTSSMTDLSPLSATSTVTVSLPADPALASRAGLSARVLPHTLALDASNALTYPASLGSVDPQILLDDDLVLGFAGRSLRLGYMDDRGTHALVMASPKGWGVSLGFRDRYSGSQHFEESGGGARTYETRDWERTFLVGMGAHRVAASGRSYEAVLAGTVMQGEQGSDYREQEEVDDPAAQGQIWKLGPGLGVGVRLRTVTASNGLLLALSGEYLDRRPEGTFSVPSTLTEKAFSGAIGWRLSYPGLDDLVLAATALWSEVHSLDVTGDYVDYWVRRDRDRTFTADVRLSGERRVLPSVVVRAGAWAPFRDERDETSKIDYRLDNAWPETQSSAYRSLDSPGISAGAGWHHAPFTFDFQASSSLNLDYFIARWALTFELR